MIKKEDILKSQKMWARGIIKMESLMIITPELKI